MVTMTWWRDHWYDVYLICKSNICLFYNRTIFGKKIVKRHEFSYLAQPALAHSFHAGIFLRHKNANLTALSSVQKVAAGSTYDALSCSDVGPSKKSTKKQKLLDFFGAWVRKELLANTSITWTCYGITAVICCIEAITNTVVISTLKVTTHECHNWICIDPKQSRFGIHL